MTNRRILAHILLLLPWTAAAGGAVTSCTESALRTAMVGGGVVTFACNGTIYLAGTITNQLDTVLDGSGHVVTISGNNAVRIFCVATNANFGLANLKIANGFSQAGSAILNLGGKVLLNAVSFSTNVANTTAPGTFTTRGCGGAIFNMGGVMNATNCSFLGNAAWNSEASGQAGGGAVRNQAGQVMYDRCRFIANQVHGGAAQAAQVGGNAAYGGALDNRDACTITRCTFAQNAAAGGAGYANYGTTGGGAFGGGVCNAGLLSINCSTFASNSVTGGDGGSGYNGGVYMDLGLPGGSGASGGPGAGGALFNSGMVAMINCTIATNTGCGGAGGNGGLGGTGNVRSGGAGGNGGYGGYGLGGVDGTCNLTNCTVALNVGAGGSGGTGGAGGWGSISSGAHGASGASGQSWGGTACAPMANTIIAYNSPPGNETYTDAVLGPLADNGGPTPTMALSWMSPAINVGDPAGAPTIDQRGFPRPAGRGVDFGAYEYGSLIPTLTITGPPPCSLIGVGNTGIVCRLLVSTNLLQWSPIATNNFDYDGTVTFSDNDGPGSCRFYRLVTP